MSWPAVLQIIRAEVGAEAAERIAAAVRRQFAGDRIYVPARSPTDPESVDAAAPGRPREAAEALGIHRATAYRALRKLREIR